MTRVVLASVPLHSSLCSIAFVIINQETEGKNSSTNLRQNFTESHLRMAAAQISSCLYTSTRDVCVSNPVRISSAARLPQKGFGRIGTTFATGSPLLIQKASYSTKAASRASSVSIKCEQSAKGGNSVDVWLGRLAMVGFAVAISVEIATGKGLLENFGLTTPLPTVALAVTALVGVLTAIFIFQSASKN